MLNKKKIRFSIKKFYNKKISGESISTDTIRNCMKMLEKLSAIEITSTTGVRLVSLGRDYDSSNGVQNIIERIQSIVPI